MTLARRFVSFLSDYGHTDEFVGVCKSVMLSLAPDLQIVDITHDLPVHDVRAGALTLVRAAQYLPDGGIVLAVVDPGVGTDRRLVAVEVEQGILLGPDNGLLAPAVAILGGAQRVISLTSTEHQLPSPGPTFAGRDVLAPAAAHLAAGVDPSELGEEVDAAGLVPGLVSLPRHDEGGAIHGEVWWIDRFGNCQLNIDPEQVAGWSDRVQLRWTQPRPGVRTARRARAFDDLASGEVGLVTDSYGLLTVALARGSAAETLGLTTGDEVVLVPLDGDEPEGPDAQGAEGVTTAVTLGRKP